MHLSCYTYTRIELLVEHILATSCVGRIVLKVSILHQLLEYNTLCGYWFFWLVCFCYNVQNFARILSFIYKIHGLCLNCCLTLVDLTHILRLTSFELWLLQCQSSYSYNVYGLIHHMNQMRNDVIDKKHRTTPNAIRNLVYILLDIYWSTEVSRWYILI